MQQTKTCFKCGKEKPITEFYKHPMMGDGHLNKCKECVKADRANHERNNPEAVLNSRLKQCERKPTQKNAYHAVEFALKAGAMQKPHECSICGKPDTESRMEAHHYDYSKPLNVIWLCTSCHGVADRARREYLGLPVQSQARSVYMIRDGERLCKFQTISEAAKAVGCAANTISDCLAGKRIKSAGFEWEYAN